MVGRKTGEESEVTLFKSLKAGDIEIVDQRGAYSPVMLMAEVEPAQYTYKRPVEQEGPYP